MPTREIRQKFKKSEIAIMAWRSSEMAKNMETSYTSGMGKSDGTVPVSSSITEGIQAGGERDFAILEEKMGDVVVNNMVNAEGDVDLRRLTGDQAIRYLSAMGLMVPMVPLKAYKGILGRA